MKNPINILYKGKTYQVQPNESILDTLLRHKVEVPHNCKKMSCMSCLMRSLNGTPPTQSQLVLKENQQIQNLFLACGCIPHRNMEIALVEETNKSVKTVAEVVEINRLNPSILELGLQCKYPFNFHGGQSVLLLNEVKVAGIFSITSPSSASSTGRFQVHVQSLPNSPLNQWVHSLLSVGDKLTVSDLNGELFYTPGQSDQALLLSAWDGNLAALIGLVQDIFEHDHSGSVYLFHGVPRVENLYYIDELSEISEYFPNFKYIPCIEQGSAPDGYHRGSVLEAMQRMISEFSGWKIFLCGSSQQVHKIQRHAYLSGAGIKDIYLEVMST